MELIVGAAVLAAWSWVLTLRRVARSGLCRGAWFHDCLTAASAALLARFAQPPRCSGLASSWRGTWCVISAVSTLRWSWCALRFAWSPCLISGDGGVADLVFDGREHAGPERLDDGGLDPTMEPLQAPRPTP